MLKIEVNDGQEDDSAVLTLHVCVQPEDAGVGEPQGPSEAVAALPLLLQPVAVRNTRVVVNLKTSVNKSGERG